MNEHWERTYLLLKESLLLEDGEERIALCEEAVREADLSGDLEAQYDARSQYVRAYFFGGVPEKALVTFSWLLAQFDQNPGKFSQWSILWKYKWMLGLICNFPQISRDRIQETLADFEARVVHAGYGLRVVYHMRYRMEKFRGNKPSAQEYFKKTIESPVDDLTDCAACLRDEIVGYSIYFGEDARAVMLAQSLLNGEHSCTTVPHRTYAKLLLPMVRLGRQQEALDFHRAGYRLIKNNRRLLDLLAQHLVFLALTENFEQAASLFVKHYSWTEHNYDSFHVFHFFRASWFLFELLSDRRMPTIDLALPQSFRKYSDNHRYSTGDLAEFFQRQADELAKQFDARNGTDFFSRTLHETMAWKKLCAPFPLDSANDNELQPIER